MTLSIIQFCESFYGNNRIIEQLLEIEINKEKLFTWELAIEPCGIVH